MTFKRIVFRSINLAKSMHWKNIGRSLDINWYRGTRYIEIKVFLLLSLNLLKYRAIANQDEQSNTRLLTITQSLLLGEARKFAQFVRRVYALYAVVPHAAPVVRLYNWIFANCMIAEAHGTIVGVRTWNALRYPWFVICHIASLFACDRHDLRFRTNCA